MENYLKPYKWTYLNENVERSNNSKQKTGHFRRTNGISKPRHVFVFIVNTADIDDQRSNPFLFIVHQTHNEKSDWSRAFNQFTIACELDMINAISAADIAFIMSSSTSAWLPSPLECSPQKQNG